MTCTWKFVTAKLVMISCGNAIFRKHMFAGTKLAIRAAWGFPISKLQITERMLINSIGAARAKRGKLEMVQYLRKPTFLQQL